VNYENPVSIQPY